MKLETRNMGIKMIHQNSVDSYDAVKPDIPTRHVEIVRVLADRGPLTDREVCEALGFRDMNHVRPRITELVERGQVVEFDSVRCRVTNRTVRRVAKAVEEK